MFVLFVPWSSLWLRAVGERPESVPSGLYRLVSEPEEDRWTGYPCFSHVDRNHPIQIDFADAVTPLFSYREKDGTRIRRKAAEGYFGGKWYHRKGAFIFEERQLGISYMTLCLGIAQQHTTTTIEKTDASTIRITTKAKERGLFFFLVPWFESFTHSCDLKLLSDAAESAEEETSEMFPFNLQFLSDAAKSAAEPKPHVENAAPEPHAEPAECAE